MPDLINLEVAGVNFVVTCRDSIILQEPLAAYGSFLSRNAVSDERINISLDLSLEALPDLKKLKKIFATGESWSLFQKGDAYFAALYVPVSDNKPIWAAQFDRNVEIVTLFLSEPLIRKDNGYVTVSNPVFYPLDQILLMYFLARKEGALIHAAGVACNGRGFIFPGRSGAGKTTLSRQLASGKNINLLSDDRVVVRKIRDTFRAFGTPWPGEGGIAVNSNVPLSAMFFINHAEHNRVEEISPQKALEKLISVTSIPWYDPEIMDRVLLFCKDLTCGIPAYNLFCKPGVEVADVFEQFASE
jgi:hypothetical protein